MKTDQIQAEAYRILRARYPETPRSELLELLTGAELEHDVERILGKRFEDCLVCQATRNLLAAKPEDPDAFRPSPFRSPGYGSPLS